MANKIFFGEYERYIRQETNLPCRDVRLIAKECYDKGMSKEDALIEAKKLYTEV